MEQQEITVEEKCEETIVEEITINQVRETTETVTQQETAPQAQEGEMEHHPTNDEIEEYEESQRKFRELWEKKREKVSFMLIFFLPFYIRCSPFYTV